MALSQKAFLIFPHQLFEENFLLDRRFIFYIIEDPLYFLQYKFHKQKLILHRASMKFYEETLREKNFAVNYISYSQIKNEEDLFAIIAKDKIAEIHHREVTDDWLSRKINDGCKKHKMLHQVLQTPMFLCSQQYLKEYFTEHKKFFLATFYADQRKRFNILMDGKKPVGGKWSYDEENRKKLPKNIVIPAVKVQEKNRHVQEAIDYVDDNFTDNPGSSSDFNYAVTFYDARNCLNDFIEHKLMLFGNYEDAISEKNTFLFHSVLTPYLNTGLLTPLEVVDQLLEAKEKVPMNSLEGYIRQIIGWREYMRAVYAFKGRKDRTQNFWKHKRKIPYTFWNGSTSIAPVDNTIRKALQHAYTHHIERLMVMGNIMMLCEFDPSEIYVWFMEMYIDAYDWVMVPNVYSMSQYSGGGSTTTKPYISSSNYVLKMSDHKKGAWTETWDALYWRFIYTHYDFFKNNPRLSMMCIHIDRMEKDKLKNHLSIANKFLNSLTTVTSL